MKKIMLSWLGLPISILIFGLVVGGSVFVVDRISSYLDYRTHVSNGEFYDGYIWVQNPVCRYLEPKNMGTFPPHRDGSKPRTIINYGVSLEFFIFGELTLENSKGYYVMNNEEPWSVGAGPYKECPLKQP